MNLLVWNSYNIFKSQKCYIGLKIKKYNNALADDFQRLRGEGLQNKI